MPDYRREVVKFLPLAFGVLAFLGASLVSVRVQHHSVRIQASAPRHDQALTPQDEDALTSQLDILPIPLAFADNSQCSCPQIQCGPPTSSMRAVAAACQVSCTAPHHASCTCVEVGRRRLLP